MKALLCHDHHYYRAGDDVLSKGQYHNSLWQRYIDCFHTLTVIGRDGGHSDVHEKGINISSRDHVSFTLLPNMNSIKGLLSGRKAIKAKIKTLIATHDIIILRGISEIGTLAFFEAKKQNKKIVLEMVGCSWDELWYHGSLAAKIYAPYRFFLTKYLAQRVDAISYVSQSFLQNRYPSSVSPQIKASNVQIDRSSFSKEKKKNATFKIGLIGTLKNKLKGVHIAIEACRILKSKGIADFTFHILGPGNPDNFQDQANKAGLENHVFFDGLRASGEPVFEWLRDLDLYIQPSFQEGVPRAMIEAMAQSLPCIGANAGGISELIDAQFVIPKGDAQTLADKIEIMMKDEIQRTEHSARNYDEAKKYSAETLIPIRTKFWEDVRLMVSQSQTT